MFALASSQGHLVEAEKHGWQNPRILGFMDDSNSRLQGQSKASGPAKLGK